MSRLPSYYFNSSVAKDITNVLQNDLDLFNFAIESTLKQFYVNECDEYINRYEEEFDIKTDESKDLSLIHISEPTRPCTRSRMPSSA